MMMGLATRAFVMCRILVQCDRRKLMLAPVAVPCSIAPLLPHGHEEGVDDGRFAGIVWAKDQYV